MSYIDDVRAERAQWALEERQAHQDNAVRASGTPTPATSTVRTQAAWMAGIGALGCCIPPIMPLGLFLLVLGGGLLLFSPVMAKAEHGAHQATVDQVSQGTAQGCGAVVGACVVAAVIVIGLVVVAMLAAMGVRP